MYQKEYHLGVGDVDQHLELKMSSFFNMMQEVATEHSEILGIGKSKTIDSDQFWVVVRYSVNVIRPPKYLENIIVKTYPGDDKKFIFPRYFQVESKNGEVLIRASSIWCVLKKKDHSVSFNPFNGIALPQEHMEGEEPLPLKILNHEASLVEKRKVRYSDTDLNGHLNNVKYIEYIADTHSQDFYQKYRLSHLNINYEKEVLAGEEVELSSFMENQREYICGKTSNALSFRAEIEYKERK